MFHMYGDDIALMFKLNWQNYIKLHYKNHGTTL